MKTELKEILLLKEQDMETVAEILTQHRIKFRIAGHPNGKTELHEYYESAINKKKSSTRGESEHLKLTKYATQIGCKDISSAIVKKGGAASFRRAFNREYIEK